MSYVYIRSEPELWTVGFYDPQGAWHPDSDHSTKDNAAERTAWLNGSSCEALLVIKIAEDLVRHVLYLHPDDEIAQAQKAIIEKALAKAAGMKHTKGRWGVTQRTIDGETHVSVDGSFIANCGHTGEDERLPYNREALANACLIAAAPEMYVILADIAKALDEGKERLGVGREMILRQALAKADGREA